MRLSEHFLYPYHIKYLTIIFPNIPKASAFGKVIIFVKIYAAGIER
jgi:hypothetical protein